MATSSLEDSIDKLLGSFSFTPVDAEFAALQLQLGAVIVTKLTSKLVPAVECTRTIFSKRSSRYLDPARAFRSPLADWVL